MRTFTVIVRVGLAALASVLLLTVRADPPESALGHWQFDSVRTMTEHFERLAGANSIAPPDELYQSLASKAEAIDSTIILEITEKEIITTSPEQGTKVYPYVLVGGNSASMIVEYTEPDSQTEVSTIYLVEGGIAIETIDCSAIPEKCGMAEAPEEKNYEDAAQGDVELAASADFALPPSTEAPAMDSPRVERVYFKRMEDQTDE